LGKVYGIQVQYINLAAIHLLSSRLQSDTLSKVNALDC